MTDKVDEAIDSLNSARRLGIYSADFKVVKLTSPNACEQDLIKAGVLNESNRNECSGYFEILSGSHAVMKKGIVFIKAMGDGAAKLKQSVNA